MTKLEDLAASVRQELSLEYDASSVQYIDGFIKRTKINLTNEEQLGLIQSLGAFLGQCIIENFGGAWQFDEELQSMAIRFDEANKAYPFAKVAKQFEQGLEESVYSFYTSIPLLFTLSKKKKPWWKF